MKKRIVIIPARMGSTRLPGKPLLMTGGKALVHWTYEAAQKVGADLVVVATPDPEIEAYCLEHQIDCRMTPDDISTGTDRCAHVAQEICARNRLSWENLIVLNWQCDYPLVPADDVNLLWDPRLMTINTLVYEPTNEMDFLDRNIVKVVVSEVSKKCLWFSRATMAGSVFHAGLYSYDARTLIGLSAMPRTRLSKVESLEQLTWIEHRYEVVPFMIDHSLISVNCHDDWEQFCAEVGTCSNG